MHYLFPSFLSDATEFESAKNFWRSLCQTVLIENDQPEDWEIWFEAETFDIKDYDIFPIYSLVNRDKTKGVIINQQDPEIHTKWETVAYTKTSGKEDVDVWPIQYLVFNCNLTEQSGQLFKTLFDFWVQPTNNLEKLEELIRKLRIMPRSESS